MDEATITKYITATFDRVDVVTAAGDTFFSYDPDQSLPPDRQLPFATLVTSDVNDQFSNLNRPGVFCLNIGVGKDTFRALFGPVTASADTDDHDTEAVDFSVLDQIMPHPVYGRMFWFRVLNPSAATFETLRPLLAEAYNRSVERTQKMTQRSGRDGS